VVDEADVEIRATQAGELTISRVTLAKGHDARNVFKGLPDDLCQCPHWGYVIRGRLRVWTAEGASEIQAGQAFYWPPGHAPEALEDSEFLEISPTDQLRTLYDHLAELHESH
jgi:quercetin dioxygenase-like cupin family protein